MITRDDAIEQYVRERFESGLKDMIDVEIEHTRKLREEATAEQIEERLREEFEQNIEDLIDEVEEELADEDDLIGEEEAA